MQGTVLVIINEMTDRLETVSIAKPLENQKHVHPCLLGKEKGREARVRKGKGKEGMIWEERKRQGKMRDRYREISE